MPVGLNSFGQSKKLYNIILNIKDLTQLMCGHCHLVGCDQGHRFFHTMEDS